MIQCERCLVLYPRLMIHEGHCLDCALAMAWERAEDRHEYQRVMWR